MSSSFVSPSGRDDLADVDLESTIQPWRINDQKPKTAAPVTKKNNSTVRTILFIIILILSTAFGAMFIIGPR